MCIFINDVEEVSGTGIFARINKGWQYLVYEMVLTAEDTTSMVLPLPVEGDDPYALQFIDLSEYPWFFVEIDFAFPVETSFESGDGIAASAMAEEVLPVFEVGSFEASYVPRLKDFSRLDARFALSENLTGLLKRYGGYGFAVFQLDPGKSFKPHPMALKFRTSMPGELFYPTVHMHENEWEDAAHFDHTLYAQFSNGEGEKEGWEKSYAVLGEVMNLRTRFLQRDRSQGIVIGERYGYRKKITGLLKNADVRLCV